MSTARTLLAEIKSSDWYYSVMLLVRFKYATAMLVLCVLILATPAR